MHFDNKKQKFVGDTLEGSLNFQIKILPLASTLELMLVAIHVFFYKKTIILPDHQFS